MPFTAKRPGQHPIITRLAGLEHLGQPGYERGILSAEMFLQNAFQDDVEQRLARYVTQYRMLRPRSHENAMIAGDHIPVRRHEKNIFLVIQAVRYQVPHPHYPGVLFADIIPGVPLPHNGINMA